MIEGILLVDKPKTWTSFDVVNYTRRMVATQEGKKPKNCKVGHIGTLDPLATGLLVLLVGKNYTKQAETMMKQDKTYDVTMTLGQTSTTGDEEGEKTHVSDARPTGAAIVRTLEAFLGQSTQIPPSYSAIKVNGQRAYDLARQGKTVELEPRSIHIQHIALSSYSYPIVTFTCDVSSGTYIRSLVEDIGKALQTGAYMSDLRRTRIGSWSISDAVEPSAIHLENLQK